MIDCWRGVLVHTVFILIQPIYLAAKFILSPVHLKFPSTIWIGIHILTWMYILTRVTIPFLLNPLRHLPSPPGARLLTGHMKLGFKPPTDDISEIFSNTPNDGIVVLWGLLYLTGIILPTRPELLMDMLNTHNYDWEKPAISRRFLSKTIGEGLVIVEGDTHKTMRRTVAPAFSGHHINGLVPLFWNKGLAFADSIAREIKKAPNGILDVTHIMSHVTLDIIGAAGVGKDFNTINNNDDMLAKLYGAITDTNRGPLIIFFWIISFVPEWLVRKMGNTPYSRVAEAQYQLRREARVLMQEKKQVMAEKSDNQNDIISIILRSGDYSDDYLVDQLLTFLAAGHDTTASALTWTAWLLCKNPRIQDQLRIVCNAHLSTIPASEISASHFDISSIPYLTGVCNETLRLYPTVPATERHSIRSTRIGDQQIPEGTYSLISIWAINRDPNIWGPDALEFKPERWLTGPNAVQGGAKAPNALFTFLHGPRSCIGRGFALAEMKCLLAALIMRFRFELADPDEEVEVGGLVTIKPQNGMRLRLLDLKSDSA